MRMLFKFFFNITIATAVLAAPHLTFDPNEPKQIYALLVAGSNGIWNYRHQADVAHSYHLLLEKGIPASNIVTLMYDDVVNDPGNPNPGQMPNEPNGPDYYPGLKIDYRSSDVNRDIFHAALTGNKTAVKGHGTERVLESTSSDNIFLYYSDHGASGMVAMPEGSGVTSVDLHNWVLELQDANRYNQIVIYIEACESGSMFEGWTTKGFAGMTASSPSESSWATYCENGFCYADEFSIAWMKNSEAHDLNTFELEQQFKEVHDAVQKSSVHQYGEVGLETDPVGYFQGESGKKIMVMNNDHKYRKVSSRDIPIYALESKLRGAKTAEETDRYTQQLQDLYKTRAAARKWFEKLVAEMSGKYSKLLGAHSNQQKEKNYDALLKEFEASCFQLGKNTYLLEFVVQLRQFASKDVDSESLRFTLRQFCAEQKPATVGVLIV